MLFGGLSKIFQSTVVSPLREEGPSPGHGRQRQGEGWLSAPPIYDPEPPVPGGDLEEGPAPQQGSSCLGSSRKGQHRAGLAVAAAHRQGPFSIVTQSSQPPVPAQSPLPRS